MTTPLERLARRIEHDPFFLACPLRLYAESEKLSDAGLADELGCAQEALVEVRLCRAPDLERAAFQRDIQTIAAKFGLDEKALRKAVRRGQVVLQLQAAKSPLLAARDRQAGDDQ